DDAVRVLAEKLMPLAMITTPNRHEAARLLDLDEPITTATAAGMAAQRICDRFGAATCIVTGIQRHRHGSEEATDVFFDGHEVHELSHPWRDTRSTHGSGCTFSAALAAGLALGKPLPGAVELARQFIAAAVSNDLGLGHGQGPVNHLAWLELER
ncbi:MAG: PfkB family carbohydrate kinase, partial [Phycisphaeraceae bacterium]